MLPSLIRRVVAQFLDIIGDTSEKTHEAYTRKACAAIKACCPGVLGFATNPAVSTANKVAGESVDAHDMAIAVAMGDKTLVHYYLRLEVPIWRKTRAFDSPIIIAAHQGKHEILQILLEKGGTKRHPGIRREESFATVMGSAMEQETWDIAIMLLDWRVQHLRFPTAEEFRRWFFRAVHPAAKKLLNRILEYDSFSAPKVCYLRYLHGQWSHWSTEQCHLAASVLIKKRYIDLNRYYDIEPFFWIFSGVRCSQGRYRTCHPMFRRRRKSKWSCGPQQQT
jgi:hypothetical protein